LVGKPEGKILFVRSRSRWKDNIKMGLYQIGWGVDWIDLFEDRDKQRALLNTLMNLGVAKKKLGEIFD
jgi:hypothetical protein